MKRKISSPETVLQDLVKCSKCNDDLQFSADGYLTCNCEGFPFKDFYPEMILDKIIIELQNNLEETGFLSSLTDITNKSLEPGSINFSEQEVLKIVQKTLENAVNTGNALLLKRTLSVFLDEIYVDHDGKLEMYLIATG